MALSHEFVQQVLDGPFHAVSGCNAPPPETQAVDRYPVFIEHCTNCGEHIFRGIVEDGEVKAVSLCSARTGNPRVAAHGAQRSRP